MTRFTHCIVHAGTHKTGTTTVQDILAAHRSELAASGFFYPALSRKGGDHNPLAHRLAICTDDDLAAVRDEITGRTARAGVRLEGITRLILSAEELSTRICNPDPWAGFDDGAYWDHRRRYLDRLRRVLPDAAQVEVFMCFRDHEAYAHSLYATKVLSGMVEWPFPEFVRRCAPIFDYQRQVDVFAEVIGPVRVESYEQLRADLANRFFAWLGVPLRVERAPRLKATPSLDLIHWLALAVQSPEGRDERKQRAAFCRSYEPKAGGVDRVVESLWPSEEERQAFLAQCHPPPLVGWPRAQAAGRIVDRAALDRRADAIEVEFGQWRQSHGRRKHSLFSFWRKG